MFRIFIAEMSDQRAADQAKFTEQLAEMEHKLNEARREHTKAGNGQVCMILI